MPPIQAPPAGPAPSAQDFADLQQAFADFQQHVETLDQALSNLSLSIPPIGSVCAFSGMFDEANPAFSAWLHCDGRALAQADYPALFASLNHTYGSGTDTNGNQVLGKNFNLPDLRGFFLRGLDGASGRDPDAAVRNSPLQGGPQGAAVGTRQSDALRSHQHPVQDNGHHHDLVRGILGNANGGYGVGGGGGGSDIYDSTAQPVINASSNISLANWGGNETRPLNTSVYWIVRSK